MLKLKSKRVSCLLMALLTLLLTLSTSIVNTYSVYAYTDDSDLTDQDFFGIWDSNASSWSTVGKINYSYSTGSGLSCVESFVKAGDYADAKSALLTYFANRTSPETFKFDKPTDRNSTICPILMDSIFTSAGEGYISTVTLNQNYRTVELNVTSRVLDQLEGDKKISFILMGREKASPPVYFHSRENTNAPIIEVDINGTVQQIVAVEDTYIRAGDDYKAINYGTGTTLNVDDSGAPIDSDTQRAYIKFDLSGISGVPTSATLKLYGGTSVAGDTDVMVYKTNDNGWDENGMTWANNPGKTYSWDGIPGGTDWLKPTGADKEYVKSIARFNFARQLTAEYIATSNEVYASKLIEFMTDFIHDADNYSGNMDSSSYPTSMHSSIRGSNWIQAYATLKNSSSMDADANTAILKTLWKTAAHLETTEAYHPANNVGIHESKGLYYISVYFPEFIKSPDWKSLAVSRLSSLISSLNFIDDSYIEATTGYTVGAAETFLEIKEFAQLNGESFDDNYDTKLQAMAKYIMDFSLPDGDVPIIGDTGTSNTKSFVNTIGTIYDNSEMIYYGTEGTIGTLPSYTSILYPVQKMAMMRTGWLSNDLYANLNVNYGPHWHPDELSIVLAAYGRSLIVDPGAYSYTTTDSKANWLRRTTAAHNTIEINDTRQNPTNPGNITEWASNGLCDFVEGYTQGYENFTQYRDMLFVKPGFWIVSDYVKAPSGTNKYKQTWHYTPLANASIDSVTKKTVTNFGDGGPDIQVVPADPESITASLDDGYYSHAFLKISDAKYTSYVKNVSGDVTFDTVLYPTDGGNIRDVRVERLSISPSVATTVATALKIDQNYPSGDKGYYYLSHEDSPSTARSFYNYSFDGKTAYIEATDSGRRKSVFVKAGKVLKENDIDLINSKSLVNDIGVEWNGSTLEISGHNLAQNTNTNTAIAIYAPSVTSVYLNGKSIPFVRSGDYIYAASSSWYSKYDYRGKLNFGNEYSGLVKAEFDVTPQANGIDALVGYADSSIIIDGLEDLAMLIRMNPSGCFDVKNGDVYSALTNVPYTAGTKYHIKAIADTSAKVYDIYVTPAGGSEVLIASNYEFNSDAPVTNGLGRICLKGSVNNMMLVENHKINTLTTYRSSNFDSDNVGAKPNGWYRLEQSGTVSIADVPSASDKSVEINKTTSDGKTGIHQVLTPQSGSGIVIDARIRRDTSDNAYWCVPYVYSSTGTVAFRLLFTAGVIKVNYGGTWNVLQTYTLGQWYDVKVDIDTDTDKCNVYINGIQKLNGAPLLNAVDNVSKIVWYADGSSTEGTSYVDDIKVYRLQY